MSTQTTNLVSNFYQNIIKTREYRKAKKGLIFFGNSRIGKSTISCGLDHQGQNPLEYKINHTIRTVTLTPSIKEHKGYVSDNHSSETEHPNIFHFKDETIIVDLPGVGDSNMQRELINMFYMKQVFSNVKQIHFILVLKTKSDYSLEPQTINMLQIFMTKIKISHADKLQITIVINQMENITEENKNKVKINMRELFTNCQSVKKQYKQQFKRFYTCCLKDSAYVFLNRPLYSEGMQSNCNYKLPKEFIDHFRKVNFVKLEDFKMGKFVMIDKNNQLDSHLKHVVKKQVQSCFEKLNNIADLNKNLIDQLMNTKLNQSVCTTVFDYIDSYRSENQSFLQLKQKQKKMKKNCTDDFQNLFYEYLVVLVNVAKTNSFQEPLNVFIQKFQLMLQKLAVMCQRQTPNELQKKKISLIFDAIYFQLEILLKQINFFKQFISDFKFTEIQNQGEGYLDWINQMKIKFIDLLKSPASISKNVEKITIIAIENEEKNFLKMQQNFQSQDCQMLNNVKQVTQGIIQNPGLVKRINYIIKLTQFRQLIFANKSDLQYLSKLFNFKNNLNQFKNPYLIKYCHKIAQCLNKNHFVPIGIKFLKQIQYQKEIMKLIHQNNFNKSELIQYAKYFQENLCDVEANQCYNMAKQYLGIDFNEYEEIDALKINLLKSKDLRIEQYGPKVSSKRQNIKENIYALIHSYEHLTNKQSKIPKNKLINKKEYQTDKINPEK